MVLVVFVVFVALGGSGGVCDFLGSVTVVLAVVFDAALSSTQQLQLLRCCS